MDRGNEGTAQISDRSLTDSASAAIASRPANGQMGKLLYLATEDWFFASHYLDRARAAQRVGYEVVLGARRSTGYSAIEAAGIRVLDLPFDRRGLNPAHEWRAAAAIRQLYDRERPTIAHHIALKPILYGSAIARRRSILVVNNPVGMGYVFTSSDFRATMLRPPVRALLKRAMNPSGSKVIVENRADLDELIRSGMARPEDARVIPGAGVDLARFRATPLPGGVPVVLLVARMLYDKGIAEFVEASRILQQRGIPARFVMAGAPDPGNPSSIPPARLRQWADDGLVDWLGHRDDIPDLLRQASLVCLPSYREGLPKSLIEALAAGRPVVTTDVTGCNEVVSDGLNGLLVTPRDARALAAAVERVIGDKALAARFALAGRARAEARFSTDQIAAATLAVYAELRCGK